MILVPKTRYERLLTADKESHEKISQYITLLRDNGLNPIDDSDFYKETPLNKSDVGEVKVDDNKTEEKKADTSIAADRPYRHNTVTPPSPMEIANQLPDRYRLYGKRLLEYIKKHGGDTIGWDANNGLIYQGIELPDADIIVLLEHIFKDKKKKGDNPPAIKEFKKALNEIRTPKALLKPYLLKPPGISKDMKKNWKKY